MNEPSLMIEKIQNSILHLTLNRPEKRNALNIPLLTDLTNKLEKLIVNQEMRVLILDAAGPTFCAGLDLAEASHPETEKESSELLAKVFTLLPSLPQFTICVVHGAALAGGAGLACAFDYVLAAEHSQFGFPEVRRGLVAAQAGVLLRRRISEGAVRELLLLGDNISAERARDIGLINRIAPQQNLLKIAYQIAETALHGAPGAIKKTKALIEALSARSMEDEFEGALEFHRQGRLSEEAMEGMKAFLEKRQPIWDKVVESQSQSH